MMRLARPKVILFALCLQALFLSKAFAWDLRGGGSLGLGGAGILTAASVGGTSLSVQRAETPGVVSIFVDSLMSDTFMLGIEHSRGFRLGPFSSGVGFTGFTGRWFFMGPAPTLTQVQDANSTYFVKRYTPFLGSCFGVAEGQISRVEDQVPSVTGSGVYTGIKVGIDYATAPGRGARIEMIYNTTLMSTGPIPAYLTEFAIQYALFFSF